MPDWRQLASLINFGMAYYTTQLVRCAIFSFVLLELVMLLRKIFFSKRTFLRGMPWALFLIIPFLGRLKMFYENEAVRKATWRITAVTASWLWADRIYMVGILIAAICIFGKWIRLQRAVSGMEKVMFENVHVYVTDMSITPFTVGLLKPKIVLTKVMVDSYSVEDLKTIVQHEQTHIRLGHLWFGFAWDILRCLLWINPLLTVFQKHFRADMEDVCDRVCIQNSGKTAHEYGMVLLKTLKLLRSESEAAPLAVTYVGEREFADMKRRMGEIVSFHPYRKKLCMGMAAAAFLMIAAMLLAVHTHSYARSNESRDILIGKYDGGNEVVSCDTEELSRMISYDDEYVYVKREAFEKFLIKNNVEGEIWIVFGGFYKLPGLTGVAESCTYENNSEDEAVRIPYESIMDDWYVRLLKML
ncbi:M56 family metallopeptidase [Parablautia muri]|uniref:M56 family metallopeptidase n=1 Tax=Parablautia muri TaxID=2320879 RepID=A0A9X5BIJ2_9FIRM|nr:M56 family metallopeptidase [Parablautia muri]NBJ94610.1 M56 family metallopeptidase [Parablautia muri]